MKYETQYTSNGKQILCFENGYKATIAQDEDPGNPFDSWECEPPIAVANFGRHHTRLENYGGEELNLTTLLHLTPKDRWDNGDVYNVFSGLEDFDTDQTLAQLPDDERQDMLWDIVAEWQPSSWTEWSRYFDTMEAVANLAGIPCHNTESNGSCQGDTAQVFVAATPTWAERVGAPADTLEQQAKNATELWAAWAWGDVYGVAKLHRPDGSEVDDAALWGFYGNHDESGLMEHLHESITADIAYLGREAKEAGDMACRDIFTHA